ncbi:MAG: hypothetical protein ACPKMZ_03665 [Pleomorphochaeta sp.]
MKKKILILLVSIISLSSPIFATYQDSLINKEDSPVQFFVEYETGFLDVLYHTIQIGNPGDLFNYVTQGGQDILFPVERFKVGAVINKRHRVTLLYQPFEINTVVPFEESVKIDGKDIGEDASSSDPVPVELKYSFPFWRISYGYDVLKDPNLTLAVGASLQIRNASIVFKEVGGSQASVSQNVGPVPALYIYARWETPYDINITADITGSYASSAILNGANFEFEGSLLDASLRVGYNLKHNMEIYTNFRFLGGTSKGTSSYDGSSWSVASLGGRYGENNLATFSTTVGFTIR